MKSLECKLHNYETIAQGEDGIVDRCLTCHKRLVTRIGKDGKINNRKYLREHKRDFLQSYHQEYDKTYKNNKKYSSKETSFS